MVSMQVPRNMERKISPRYKCAWGTFPRCIFKQNRKFPKGVGSGGGPGGNSYRNVEQLCKNQPYSGKNPSLVVQIS